MSRKLAQTDVDVERSRDYEDREQLAMYLRETMEKEELIEWVAHEILEPDQVQAQLDVFLTLEEDMATVEPTEGIRASKKTAQVIELDNLEDRGGAVLVTASWPEVMVLQSVGDAKWEHDGDFAYALVTDYPGLIKELELEGYELNLDNYVPPDEFEEEACELEGKASLNMNIISSLLDELKMLRSQIAREAQTVYDNWEEGEDSDFGGGGICDEIAVIIGSVIASNIGDVQIEEGGHEGDEHAWIIAHNGKEAYGVNIPAYVYEEGGGYSWEKIPGVEFSPDDVEIFKIRIEDVVGDES